MSNLKFSISKALILSILLLSIFELKGQSNFLSLEKAIEIALENNIEYKSYVLSVEQSKVLKKSAFTIDKTNIFYGKDNNNMAENGHPLNIIGIEQSFSFPTVYTNQYKVNKTAVSLSETELEKQRSKLIKQVSKEYYEIVYFMNKINYYKSLDSLYRELSIEVENKHRTGNSSDLDVLNIRAKHRQILISIDHLSHDINTAHKKLMLLINDQTPFEIPKVEPAQLIVTNTPLIQNPAIQFKKFETQMQESIFKVEKSRLLPDITLSLYNGTNRYPDSKNYPGFQIGISVPIFFGGHKSTLKAGKIGVAIGINEEERYLRELKLKREELMNEVRKLRESLKYFSTTGKRLSEEIINSAKESLVKKEIDLFQYVQSIENAITIELEHLDWLAEYNNVVLELNYLEI